MVCAIQSRVSALLSGSVNAGIACSPTWRFPGEVRRPVSLILTFCVKFSGTNARRLAMKDLAER